MPPEFKTEADLVKCFIEALQRDRLLDSWTPYHESCGFDLMLVHKVEGTQIGIEAKLRMNAKVISQALPRYEYNDDGPDFRAVLVPFKGVSDDWSAICQALGLSMIASGRVERGLRNGIIAEFTGELPNPTKENWWADRRWTFWNPIRRCKLPEYVPDVTGGKPSPLTLTPWKIKAIKLLIVLDRRGFVTRRDMRGLKISPSYWCDHWAGHLAKAGGGKWIRTDRTPDFKAQHPENWQQIEADIDEWAKPLDPLDRDLDPGGQEKLIV